MSSPQIKNIFLPISANQNYILTTSSPRRGVGRRHCTLGWDAVDVVSALDEALSAYGEVVWSWRRDAGVKLVE